MEDKQTDQEALKVTEALGQVDAPATKEPKVQEQPVEEPETAEKPVETPEEPQEAPETPDAKAFQAMRKEIKDLRKQLESKPAAEVEPLVPNFESQPQVPNYGQTQVNQNQFFNPDTGEFDAVGYQNAVLTESRRVSREESQRTLDEERQTNEAYASYPELNPTSKDFDPDLYDATSAILLQSMVKGSKVTVKQATEKALGLSKKALKQAVEQGAQATMNDIAAKESASLEATANSGRSTQDYGDIEALQNRTRQGGNEGAAALTERLRRSGF